MTHHPSPTEESISVIGGVDTHLEFHVAAVINALGALLGTATFPATPAGYAELLAWLSGYGPLAVVGVEGTGSYGHGLATSLAAAGIEVIEVNRPDRADRRRRGKSDTFDAEAAARAVLAGRGHTAKINTGPFQALRMLKLGYDSAVKQRTAIINQMHQIRATAPEQVRTELAGYTKKTMPARCARYRVPTDPAKLADPVTATRQTLRSLARRVLDLTTEADQTETALATLVHQIAPATVAQHGIGIHTAARLLITLGENPDRFRSEAAFAALCGVSPIPASSGKTHRHRLNRGGDRQANSALHMAITSRLATHQPTRDYITTRTPDGKSDAHLRRKLKRYLARQLYPILRADLQALNTQPITT
jgi:transposase